MKEPQLRVLHIITGLGDGGAESALYRLCRHDEHCEHQVVSLMDVGKYGSLLLEAGIPVYSLGMQRGKLTVSDMCRLWSLIRAARPDVVQTWMYHADLLGGLAGRFARVSHVYWGLRHSNLTPGTVRRSTIWVARLCASLSRWVPRQIVSCSRQAAQAHVQLGYAADKFVVIPNGYDLAQFEPDPVARRQLRAEWGIPDDMPLLGMVARFDPQKDHANLAAALGQLKQGGTRFHCVLIGTGMEPGNEQLRAWLAAEGLTEVVSLLGRRSDIPAVMSALDVHVLSSLGEAFPNVLAEAMACGTPCVTTDVGDAALIVGETGWIVPSGDPAALAGALEKALGLWRQPEEWSARQAAARQRIVDHFAIEKMIQAYHSVWTREPVGKARQA